MSRREVPYISAYFELLPKASYTATQASATLDTLGYAHGYKGNAMAAGFLLNAGAWTSGTWTATLMESDNFAGPWTQVDPMNVKWYALGFVHPGVLSITNSGGGNQIYAVSYVAGLKRYLQLDIGPTAAGTLVVGIMGLLTALGETQDRAFSNYPNDLALAWPSP
jgi:hypothetical protein